MNLPVPPAKLHPGSQRTLFTGAVTGPTTIERKFINQADSLLLTLFVNSTAGDVTVRIYALNQGGPNSTEADQKLLLFTFPVISAPTTELVVNTVSVTAAELLLVIETTADADLEVQGRAINGGASNVRVVTAGNAFTDQKTINSGVAQVIIPPTLTSGIGFMCRNWSSNGAVIYLSET